MTNANAPAPDAAAPSALDMRIERAFALPARLWIPGWLAFVAFFDFWDAVAIAIVTPALSHEWDLSYQTIGLLISAGYAGQFCGAAAFGWLADRFGRIPLFVIASVLMSVLAGACALAPNVEWLIAIRFIQGIGIGGALPIAISYLNEITPARSRGRAITIFQFIATSGTVVASIAAAIIVPEFGWRWVIAIGMAPLLILPLIYFFTPESPRWLLKAGKGERAVRILDKLDPAGAGMSAEQLSPQASNGPSAGIKDLFAAKTWRITAVIWPIWILTGFVQYGIITWLPQIYVSVYGLSIRDALHSNIVPHLMYLLVPVITALLIDRIGRRKIAIFALSVAAAMFTTLYFISEPSIITLVALTSIGQNAVSMGFLVLWAYTGELYSTRLRALGVGAASGWARGASMVTPAIIGGLLATTGVEMVYTVMATGSIAIAALWLFFCRETKGSALDSDEGAAKPLAPAAPVGAGLPQGQPVAKT
jgi:putative MFS transporter